MAHESIEISKELMLKELTPVDAESLFRLIKKDDAYLSRFLPWSEKTKSVEDSVDFIKHTMQQRTDEEEYGYGIRYNGVLIGHISLMHIKDKQPEIGYWITSAYSGRGIMTLAVKALGNFGLHTLGLKAIMIRANPKNIGSNRVAKKAGYRFDRVRKDRDGRELNEWILQAGQSAGKFGACK